MVERIPREQWPERWKDRDDIIADRFKAGGAQLAKEHDLRVGRIIQIIGQAAQAER